MDSAALLDLLGNENRRRILRLLARKPCYVTEISEYLGVSPKAVIEHLRKLEEAGLVESRTDENRRKYFHIARNLRLEVHVSPYDFGTKSAYAASPSLDIAACRHLSVDVRVRETGNRSREAGGESSEADGESGEAGEGSAASGERGVATDDGAIVTDGIEGDDDRLAELAAELDTLQELENELSLAQRWVQGRLTDVFDRLSETLEGRADARLYVELLAGLAGGRRTVGELSARVEAPRAVVEEALAWLENRGIVVRNDDGWRIVDAARGE